MLDRSTLQFTFTCEPQGASEPWTFRYGSICGRQMDSSVGISYMSGDIRVGCTLLREDVIRLRRFLEMCEQLWEEGTFDNYEDEPEEDGLS